MLREDRGAAFVEAGAFKRRRRFVAGDRSSPLTISKRRMRRLVELSDRQPVQLLEGAPDSWWLWRGRVFRTDAAYAADDVLALLVGRERRNRRRLDRAKAELHRERDVTDSHRSAIPRDVKLAVWQRDGGSCVQCGGRALLEFDHVIPLALGGSDAVRNLQILCADCNRAKGASL